LYTNVFVVPPAWAGRKIFLVFEGVFTDTSTSINGRSVGPTHRGGFYEFKYDVTTNVVVGASTNVLQVTVRRWSTDPFIVGAEEKADYWDFGGMYRPVYLEAKPPAYIDRVAANPLANGQITVNTYPTSFHLARSRPLLWLTECLWFNSISLISFRCFRMICWHGLVLICIRLISSSTQR
jgi:hypothetical protein